MRYIIVIQPADGSPDHWVYMSHASDADAFARWTHKTTGAAVSVYDYKTSTERLVLGTFDRGRV